MKKRKKMILCDIDYITNTSYLIVTNKEDADEEN